MNTVVLRRVDLRYSFPHPTPPSQGEIDAFIEHINKCLAFALYDTEILIHPDELEIEFLKGEEEHA